MSKKVLRPRDKFLLLVNGDTIAVTPADRYAATDPVVKAHRWAFVTDDELAAVEAATADPGEKRTLSK